MPIFLDINRKQLTEAVNLHFLPASIETNVQANIDEYFNIYTISENAHLINSLRGFPLDGIDFEVPLNLNGVVLQEAQRTSGYCSDRLLRITGTFNNMTYWNYDKTPSEADGLRQALEALLVVEELSKPINVEDLENEMDQESHSKSQ